MPSIIDAWFKESDIIASFPSRIVSKSPPFASKHDEYRIVSSVLKKEDI